MTGRRRVRAVRWARPLQLALMLASLSCGQMLAAQQTCGHPSSALSMPTSRFQDNGDGTVTDLESKLMWMRCSGGQQWQAGRCVGTVSDYSWREARQHAERVNRDATAFFNDWRLPALRELATITDRACKNPRTNVAVFPDTAEALYWSATSRAADVSNEQFWALGFGTDGIQLSSREARLHLRLVRTGP